MRRMNIVYYPQMAEAVQYYRRSPCYRGEPVLPLKEFEERPEVAGGVVVLGTSGNSHHHDIRHIQLLRERGKIPASSDTTLVVYDWHEDIDHDPRGTDLTAGSWVYVGLATGLYANVYIVGTNPRGFNELNPFQYEDEIRPTTEEMLRVLDRVYLFPAERCSHCLKLFSECERFLAQNCSVEKYFAVKEGGFVQVRFKSMREVTYRHRKGGIVVSIDLDVLKRSELRADCPQGVMSVDELLAEMEKLRGTGPINAVLICGLTQSAELCDERSFLSLSRIIGECCRVTTAG